MTLVEVMLVLVVLVVVPVGLRLHPRPSEHLGFGVVAGAGFLASASLLLQRGTLSAFLAAPWVLVAIVSAAVAAWGWWIGPRGLRDAVWPVASAYLVVGAIWLLCDRLDLEPAGFSAPFVQLTAIHFHYAGFTAATLGACAVEQRPQDRTLLAGVTLLVIAPPFVALGFTWVPALQIAGASMLAVGLWLLAFVQAIRIAPTMPQRPRLLLRISAASVLVPMLLAVQWAVGTNLGTPALSIPDMARTHGVLNALGFSTAGVAGWRLAFREFAAAQPIEEPG